MVDNYKESDLQIKISDWLKVNYPDLLFWHTPNGEKRDIIIALKLKRMGVRPGVPDFFIPKFKLFIEFKRNKRQKLTTEQKEVKEKLQEYNYKYIILYNFKDSVEILTSYLTSSSK
jgi:hypothetical protein